MSNIMDIAKSAIGVYRTALGVTGENIANVNTEGYRRRDVTTEQIGGARTTVTTLATGGQGVEIDQIRRAFDELLAQRLRTASADLSSAEVHHDAALAVETVLLPRTGGIDAQQHVVRAVGQEMAARHHWHRQHVGGHLPAHHAAIGLVGTVQPVVERPVEVGHEAHDAGTQPVEVEVRVRADQRVERPGDAPHAPLGSPRALMPSR